MLRRFILYSFVFCVVAPATAMADTISITYSAFGLVDLSASGGTFWGSSGGRELTIGAIPATYFSYTDHTEGRDVFHDAAIYDSGNVWFIYGGREYAGTLLSGSYWGEYCSGTCYSGHYGGFTGTFMFTGAYSGTAEIQLSATPNPGMPGAGRMAINTTPEPTSLALLATGLGPLSWSVLQLKRTKTRLVPHISKR